MVYDLYDLSDEEVTAIADALWDGDSKRGRGGCRPSARDRGGACRRRLRQQRRDNVNSAGAKCKLDTSRASGADFRRVRNASLRRRIERKIAETGSGRCHIQSARRGEGPVVKRQRLPRQNRRLPPRRNRRGRCCGTGRVRSARRHLPAVSVELHGCAVDVCLQ